ncbi:MAG: hypothetical protein LW859_16965 [Anabaena sp. 49633_E8]|nr:hypothetical protein [Anabaena sp. 49633_E8]
MNNKTLIYSIWKINYRSLPKIVLQMLRPYSCQLLVVSCHWEEIFLLPLPVNVI